MLDSTPNVWCDYSILTNLYKVHTKWHRTHQNYVNSKLKLLNANNLASINVELKSLIPERENIVWFGPGTDYYFDDKYVFGGQYKIPLEKVKIGGAHNYQNIASCLPILEAENISQKDIEKVLEEFNGLEHRQEFIGEFNGVKYYNDSIATIPESVLQVLSRFGENLDTIIL
jgi:UDP-N-acetylmuramoylalanine--D-glutamate ligase